MSIPNDLCSSSGIGAVRKDLGDKEESFVVNVCKIRDTADDILKTFKSISNKESNIDVDDELSNYKKQLRKIEDIARNAI